MVQQTIPKSCYRWDYCTAIVALKNWVIACECESHLWVGEKNKRFSFSLNLWMCWLILSVYWVPPVSGCASWMTSFSFGWQQQRRSAELLLPLPRLHLLAPCRPLMHHSKRCSQPSHWSLAWTWNGPKSECGSWECWTCVNGTISLFRLKCILTLTQVSPRQWLGFQQSSTDFHSAKGNINYFSFQHLHKCLINLTANPKMLILLSLQTEGKIPDAAFIKWNTSVK